MANSDTILALNGSPTAVTTPARNILASQGSLGTGQTLITMGTDAATNVTAFLPFVGQTDIVGRANPMSINANPGLLLDQWGAKAGERGASAPYFNTNTFNGRAFRLRFQALFTTSAGSNTITVKFLLNTKTNGPVTGSALTLGTIAIGGAALGALSGTVISETLGMWDSVSGNAQGAENWGSAAGSYATRAVTASTVAVTAPISNYIWFVTVTFGAGAANVITPVEMAYEDV